MRIRRERALCPPPAFLLASVASGPIISTARPNRKRPVPPYPLPRRPPTFRATTDRTLRALGSRRDRPDNPARIFTKDSSVAGKHTAQRTDHRIPDTKPEKSCAPVRSHDAFRTVPSAADRPVQKEGQISIQKTPVPAFCRPPRRQTGSLPPSRCEARRRRAPKIKRRISMTAYRHPAAVAKEIPKRPRPMRTPPPRRQRGTESEIPSPALFRLFRRVEPMRCTARPRRDRRFDRLTSSPAPHSPRTSRRTRRRLRPAA